MANHDNYNNLIKLHNFTTILYNKGFSIFDILSFVEESRHIDDKYKYIVYIKKIKNEFRDEKLIIFISLYYIFLRKEVPLENILNI
jgi:hypothetical protein